MKVFHLKATMATIANQLDTSVIGVNKKTIQAVRMLDTSEKGHQAYVCAQKQSYAHSATEA